METKKETEIASLNTRMRHIIITPKGLSIANIQMQIKKRAILTETRAAPL